MNVRRMLIWLLILGSLGCAGATNSARAAAIRGKAQIQTRQAQVRAYWDQYYTRALREQRLQIKGLNALKVLRVNPDGTLPQTSMVAYLKWRHSLNPARFARFHPQLAEWIVRDIIIRGIPKPPTPNPTPGGVNPPPPPQVPEPSTFVIAGVLVFSGLCMRRISQRRNGLPGAG